MKVTILILISLMHSLTMACDPFSMRGIPDIVRGYAISIVDTTANQTNTDCYKDSDRLATKLTIFYTSFGNLSRDTWIDPLKYSNQLVVDLSNHMQSC
jgi:hypothetical protein